MAGEELIGKHFALSLTKCATDVGEQFLRVGTVFFCGSVCSDLYVI